MENSGIIEDIRFIVLTKHRFTIVDPEDVDKISQYSWHLTGGYAMRTVGIDKSHCKAFLLANEILNVKRGVDHRNHFKLDNRRSNLRLATRHQNAFNYKKVQRKKKCLSIYKGVTFSRNRWVARILFYGKSYYLGCFDNEIAAAKVYDNAAKFYFKEFAWLNFPNS